MLADPQSPQPPARPTPAAQGVGEARRIDSATLLGKRGEVLIVHHEQVYRLRVTSLGKLILTK
jgi:hemin uptake protein HemP